MTPEMIALVQLVGAPAAIVLVLVFRDWIQSRTSAKQDNAITDLAVDSNAERRERQKVIDELQKSNNHLQAEVFNIQMKQAEVTGDYAGRLAEVKEAMLRERDEWKVERLANDEKFRLMASDISGLKEHRDQSVIRIRGLESQITELEHKLSVANVENDILQAQKRELESLLELQRNRADSLSSQITRMQLESTADKTIPIPDMRDVDDTITPLPRAQIDPDTTNKAAVTITAEETKP